MSGGDSANVRPALKNPLTLAFCPAPRAAQGE